MAVLQTAALASSPPGQLGVDTVAFLSNLDKTQPTISVLKVTN
jgi:hypothetical protein